MYQPQPQVVGTLPEGFSQNVDTKIAINLFFNVDLDRNHISDSIYLLDNLGNKVDSYLSYNNRVVTVQPVQELNPSTTYTVHVIGGLDANNQPIGVRSVLDAPLAQTFLLTFTTVIKEQLDAPDALTPPFQSTINTEPTFSWTAVPGAATYQIQVSSTTMMSPIIWPSDALTTAWSQTEIIPDIPFADGTYYWSVRAVAPDGSFGKWSPVFVFNKDTQVRGTQASGDTVAPDVIPFYEEYPTQTLELVESYPSDKGSAIATNLKTIYLRLSGTYDSTQITSDMFTITGENVDGMINNPEFPVHGTVTIDQLDVLSQKDGTTILKLTLATVPSQAFLPNLP